jgi:hypothetical protein
VIGFAEGMHNAGLDVLKNNLGRAEPVRIDRVEVVVITGEDRRERLAVVTRGRRRDLRAERNFIFGELLVSF